MRVVINNYSFFLRNCNGDKEEFALILSNSGIYSQIELWKGAKFTVKTCNLELPVLQNGNEDFKVIANDLKLSYKFVSNSKNKYIYWFPIFS